MKQKLFMRLAAVATVLLLSAATAMAHDFEVDGIFYKKNSDGTSVSVTYKGISDSDYSNEYSGSVTIPSEVTYDGITYTVTEVGDYAFRQCSSLNAVDISDSVVYIGSFAFNGCSNLSSVRLGEGITRIGDHAFYNLRSISVLEFNAKNCAVQTNAFLSCPINTIVFGKQVESIPDFFNGNSVSTIVSLSSTPPSCSFNLASKFGTNIPVYVLSSSYSAYWIDTIWGQFSNLQSISEPVVNVKFDIEEKRLAIRETLDLRSRINFTPSNASLKTLVWKSDNANVATVDNDGYVSALAKGVTTITARTIDGSNLEASCVITVDSVLATSISFNQTKLTLLVNNSATLTCQILPSNVTVQEAQLISSNNDVVLCKNNGVNSVKVLGLNEGSATITARTTDGSNLETSCVITVDVIPEIKELRTLVAKADSIYENSVEGVECGQYAPGSRDALLSAINDVKAKMSSTMSTTLINECTETINNAIAQFMSQMVPLTDTDLSQYDNVLYVERSNALIGKEVKLSLKMNNVISAVGFQCDFYAPQMTSVAKDDEGFYLIELSEDRTSHSVTNLFDAAEQTDGAIRIIASSSKSIPISGNSGEVATIMLAVSDSIQAGEYQMVLRNIVISDENGVSYSTPYVKTTITISDYNLGDVNTDGSIDIGDYTSTVNFVLGREPKPFKQNLADLNGDSKVNVADLPCIINLILDGAQSPAPALSLAPASRNAEVAQMANAIYASDINIAQGGTAIISVKMRNDKPTPAFQFDMVIPEGFEIAHDDSGDYMIALSEVRTDFDKTNVFGYARQSDNCVRVLAASMHNNVFSDSDGEVCTITLRATEDVQYGSYIAMLQNVVISDVNGVTCHPNATSVNIDVLKPTEAELVEAEGCECVEFFSADGIRRTKLLPGFNIVRYANGITKKVYINK